MQRDKKLKFTRKSNGRGQNEAARRTSTASGARAPAERDQRQLIRRRRRRIQSDETALRRPQGAFHFDWFNFSKLIDSLIHSIELIRSVFTNNVISYPLSISLSLSFSLSFFLSFFLSFILDVLLFI